MSPLAHWIGAGPVPSGLGHHRVEREHARRGLVDLEQMAELRYAFHDSRADLGHLLEVYEPSPGLLALYATVAEAARSWDGDDPVREW